VLAPVIGASLYWGLIANKQYLTEAKFSLQAADGASWTALGVSSRNEKQMQDAQILTKYILSRTLIEEIDKQINIRQRFSRPETDYFSRFDQDAPIEKLEKYWKKRVDANVDLMSGIITVDVRAFTPQDSLAITQNIIEFSEKLVNELSTRVRQDALSQAQSVLTRAEGRVKAASAALRDARNAEGVLDATAAAEAMNKIVTQLRLKLATAEESQALQSSAFATNSPQAKFLNARVESLKKQIAEYTTQIASAENSRSSMAGHAGVLSERQVDLSLAQQQYARAAVAYESARIDVDRQRTYLATFLRPTLAEKSTYPRRWFEWSIIVFPAIIGWGMLAAIAFLVRDHMAK
jgi:capsular polysaccharide transport system permease protein